MSFVLVSCGSSIKKNSDTAEGQYEYAKALAKDERFEEALLEFSEVKNKHPYSRFAIESELEIADIHFKRESYVESQTAYEIFKSLHPKHEKSDLVTFRIGQSYYHELPATIDRDLTLADKAIFYFDQLINSYPRSTYVTEAKERILEIRQMQAEKELYIARFYLKKENFLSAQGRFEGLLEKFPTADFGGEVLYGASISAFRTGEESKGKKYYQQLVKNFADSNFADMARKELKRYVDN